MTYEIKEMEPASQTGNISKQPFSLCTAVRGSSSGLEVSNRTEGNLIETGLRPMKRMTMRMMMLGRWKKEKTCILFLPFKRSFASLPSVAPSQIAP